MKTLRRPGVSWQTIAMRSIGPCILAVGAALSGCKPQSKGPMPLCLAEVAHATASEAQAQELPPDVWISILLRDFDRSTMQSTDDPRDCTGRRIRASSQSAQKCAADGESASPRDPAPLGERDLVQVPAGPQMQLVWVKALKYDNGEAMGPIALAEWTKRGVAVRSLGTLRAHGHKPNLRLEPFGEHRILVVESQKCTGNEPQDDCVPIVRFMPLISGRFMDVPLIAEDSSCLGRAEFPMYRRQEASMSGGQTRVFEMTRTLDMESGQPVITEQVVIKDTDPEQEDLPPKVFRKATAQRAVRLSEAGLVTTRGLWDEMLDAHGSVRAE